VEDKKTEFIIRASKINVKGKGEKREEVASGKPPETPKKETERGCKLGQEVST